MNEVTIAQIGVGYWGPNLLRNADANPRVNVKYVVDISEDRKKYIKNSYPHIFVTKDFSKVLNDDEIDGVIIATPVATHFDIAMRCLEKGKHVLVEKPMASSSNQIDLINKIAKKNKLVAMVGHTFLFNSAVRFLKELIDDGILGDIRYIYCQRLNLGRIRNDVDALWNLAPHDISIVQYLLGEPKPKNISKIGQSYVQEGIDDVVFLNIDYPGNVMTNIHVSWLDPHKVRCITVVGSKKMVIYDDIAENKIKIYDKGIDRVAKLGERMDFDSGSHIQFHHRSGEVLLPKIDWVEPLEVEGDHFVACMLGKEVCITDADHAKKVVKILEQNI